MLGLDIYDVMRHLAFGLSNRNEVVISTSVEEFRSHMSDVLAIAATVFIFVLTLIKTEG